MIISAQMAEENSLAPTDPPPYETESQWRQALLEIQEQLTAYQDAKAKSDRNAIIVTEGLLVDAMRRPAQIRPDSEEGKQWEQRAKDFVRADNEGKKNILEGAGIGKGLLLIVGAPIVAAGAVVYGTGKVLIGIGEFLTFGTIGKFKKAGKNKSGHLKDSEDRTTS